MTEDELLRRMSELERRVTQRLAEHDQQMRDLRRSTEPDGTLALAVHKVVRKARRIPASLRRRTRSARRARRLVSEQPKVSNDEQLRRRRIVNRYLHGEPN